MLGPVYVTIKHKFYIDEIYLFVTKNVIFQFVARPIAYFDRHVVDGGVNVTAQTTVLAGSTLRIDGARPQVRMGWPMRVASGQVRERDAIKPFEGFHRATTPEMFSK